MSWPWWLVAAASLWLRSGFPTRALGGAVYDDALFVRLAGLIGQGQWLGPYDNLTLAKGVFYPLFILAAFVAGIPLNIAEHGLYLASCALAAHAVRRSAGARAGLAVFAALAFNPVLLHVEMARVIREAVYASLCLALPVLLARAVLPAGCAPMPPRQALWRGLALGLGFGAYWLTREEGIWLLPALACVLLLAASSWRRVQVGRAALALAGCTAAAIVGAVALANQSRYGVFTTNEFKSPWFERGYGALARIRHDRWQRHVAFPKDARERAYAASPAAAELRPLFEGLRGEEWRRKAPPDTMPLALAVASLAAIASRVALLAYLDVTSIPSANVLYASPASPFVILFAVLGCVLGWRALRPDHPVEWGAS